MAIGFRAGGIDNTESSSPRLQKYAYACRTRHMWLQPEEAKMGWYPETMKRYFVETHVSDPM